MEEVLQGVRGMRQSMLDMHRTRAQASFARVVGSALRGLSAAVDDTLEATSRRSAVLPASILACCHRVSGAGADKPSYLRACCQSAEYLCCMCVCSLQACVPLAPSTGVFLCTFLLVMIYFAE